ncbi:hypothetical protein BKA65DRAFT_480782 [Rhexocercosporidium sp. MPI-PUGE-AT-0058]|nr:hypothetical protein BKA65DRAFT_480782 [Rhexocercosporidium sp. MPI-PUGE-AT-0058]
MDTIYQSSCEPQFDYVFGVAENRSSCQSGTRKTSDAVSNRRLSTTPRTPHFDTDPFSQYLDSTGNKELPSPLSTALPSVSGGYLSGSSIAEYATPLAAMPTLSPVCDIALPSTFHIHEMKEYACPYLTCLRSFTRPCDLLRHSQIHTATKYHCLLPGCPAAGEGGYWGRAKLTEHLWKRHGDLGFCKGDLVRTRPPETTMAAQVLLASQESEPRTAFHDSRAVLNEKCSSMPSFNNKDVLEVAKRPQFIILQGQGLGQQETAGVNENVRSFDMIDAKDDRWKEFPATEEQTTSCGENIMSNRAPWKLMGKLSSIESPSEKFVGDIFQEHYDQPLSSPASSFTSHGSENTHSSSSSEPEIWTPTSHRVPRKRTDKNNEEDEDDNESWGYKKPKVGLSKGPQSNLTKTTGRRLACLFHISNSEKYCKNGTTCIKYNSCSGPGFPEWHYLKCLEPFKTANAALKHMQSEPSKCPRHQTCVVEEDIDQQTWTKIDQEVSRQGFAALPELVSQTIKDMVERNVVAYAPEKPLETRKAELIYDNETSMSVTKTSRLVKTFKETVETCIEAGEIEGINEDTLEKLQECLRTAIKTSSRNSQETLGHQAPSTSTSLQSLQVRESTVETPTAFASAIILQQAFNDSSALERHDHNDLIGPPVSDYMSRDFLEAQQFPPNFSSSHRQPSVDNQINNSDFNTTANDNHVDMHNPDGRNLVWAQMGEERDTSWDDLLNLDGSIPSDILF